VGTITIVLADDHPIVRQGLRTLLGKEPDLSVVGEAADGKQALALAERLKPSVLMVDLQMPGLNGLEVTRQVSRLSPHTRVLILSMHANAAYVTEVLRDGATGYVLKDTDTSNLIQAVREVAAGRRYVSQPISDLVIETYLQKVKGGFLDPYETLTIRERQVLHLAAEGSTTAEIAKLLAIIPRTVETHRAHVMRKLGLKTQTDLVRYYGLRHELSPHGN
jgi:DNA-binding NarL/FixJ family response regulator